MWDQTLNCPSITSSSKHGWQGIGYQIKEQGDSGSSCLRPLKLLKYSPLSPLRSMQTLRPLTAWLIQWIQVSEKPFLCKVSSRKSQLTSSVEAPSSFLAMDLVGVNPVHLDGQRRLTYVVFILEGVAFLGPHYFHFGGFVLTWTVSK